MWFDVDKSGLAAMLERRGKSFAIFELVQNAWDSGATNVSVTLEPLPGVPFARLIVVDDSPEGFADLDDAFTMFSRSKRGSDPLKRGRFCLGEKLVLALCREARIETTTGAVEFTDKGRRRLGECRESGTRFVGEIRMTRDEFGEVEADAMRLIPPITTGFNGTIIERPKPLAVFETRLPTEIADAEGNLRRSMRVASVEAFASDDATGDILEMGIPVCSADWPWRLNVQQKVPLGMDRDSVTDAFRRALQVAAVNALAETIDEEQAAQPWACEAIGDARIAPEALQQVIKERFGDRAVIATPGDPMANAAAEAMGCTVVHGGALSADAWANMRKNQTIPTTSQSFPSPKPQNKGSAPEFCPLCKQQVR